MKWLEIVGWVLWVVVALYAGVQIMNRNPDPGVRSMTRMQATILVLGLIGTLFFSKLHLIWIAVAAFFLPMWIFRARALRGIKRFDKLIQESKRTGEPLKNLIDKDK